MFTDRILRIHENLSRARSSLLIQARTGFIGLKDFLFKVKVPGVVTPYCECGMGRETVEHLVVWCSKPPKPRPWRGAEISSRRDLYKVLHGEHSGNETGMAKTVVDWLLGSGRLPEYRLASKLDMELGQCLTQPA